MDELFSIAANYFPFAATQNSIEAFNRLSEPIWRSLAGLMRRVEDGVRRLEHSSRYLDAILRHLDYVFGRKNESSG